MRRFAVLVPALLLSACHSTVHHPSIDVSDIRLREDIGRYVTYSTELNGYHHHVSLDEESRTSEGIVYRIHSLKPEPTRPVEPAELKWVFAKLATNTSLRTAEGTLLEHPDRAALLTLLAEIKEKGVEGTLARLPALLRPESRARVFAALCRSDLAPAATGALIEAAHPGGALGAPTFEGIPVEISSSARSDALQVLAATHNVASADADSLARLAPSIGYDSYERQLLVRLVRSSAVSTQVVLEATAHIKSASAKRDVFMALVARRPGVEDAERIAQAAPGIGYDGYEKEVLVALVQGASPRIPTVLRSAEQIRSSSDRRDLLMQLSKRSGLTANDADLLAGATPQVGYDSYEKEILLTLLARCQPSTAAILTAVRSIAGRSSQRDVLMALAERRAARDAKAIAAATPRIGYDSYEKEVLVALASRGARTPVLEASAEIRSSSDHRDVLMVLAQQSGLSPALADRIAASAPKIGYDSYEREVLLALIARARPSTRAVLGAVRSIASSSHHREVLIALAKRPRLSTEEANAIARAAPKIGYDKYEAELLVLLSRKADSAAIKSSLKFVGAHSARLKILEALVR